MASPIIRGAVLALALAAAAQAQTPPAAPGGQAPAGPAPAGTPSAGAARTLAPSPADPANPDEVTLQPRPALAVSGASSWAEGFATLKGAVERLNGELGRAGLKAAGRPLALFTETDDAGFRFEAMIPVEEGAAPALGADFRLGRTPEGRAVRFVHKAPYDDIDSTYETVTAYLDVKGVVVKDTFVEEYLADLTSASEPIEINIYALPR